MPAKPDLVGGPGEVTQPAARVLAPREPGDLQDRPAARRARAARHERLAGSRASGVRIGGLRPVRRPRHSIPALVRSDLDHSRRLAQLLGEHRQPAPGRSRSALRCRQSAARRVDHHGDGRQPGRPGGRQIVGRRSGSSPRVSITVVSRRRVRAATIWSSRANASTEASRSRRSAADDRRAARRRRRSRRARSGAPPRSTCPTRRRRPARRLPGPAAHPAPISTPTSLPGRARSCQRGKSWTRNVSIWPAEPRSPDGQPVGAGRYVRRPAERSCWRPVGPAGSGSAWSELGCSEQAGRCWPAVFRSGPMAPHRHCTRSGRQDGDDRGNAEQSLSHAAEATWQGEAMSERNRTSVRRWTAG